MVQQTQLRELIKYIEENMDTAVSSYDAKQIKKILGGILLDEPVRILEQPALNPIEQAYERGEKIRRKDWNINSYTRKYDLSAKKQFTWHGERINPEEWELYTEPTEQPSSQAKLDNLFDKDRFEAMFRAVVASGEKLDFEYCKRETTYFIQQLDAYYASKEKGGNNE